MGFQCLCLSSPQHRPKSVTIWCEHQIDKARAARISHMLVWTNITRTCTFTGFSLYLDEAPEQIAFSSNAIRMPTNFRQEDRGKQANQGDQPKKAAGPVATATACWNWQLSICPLLELTWPKIVSESPQVVKLTQRSMQAERCKK